MKTDQLPSDWDPRLDRRDFLTYSLASLAVAGFSGCIRPPIEKIFSYVERPEEDALPGEFRYYATAQTLGGFAQGMLVESHQGRPTKIEGNPSHPANRGSASAFQQASILSLYDPDRAQSIREANVTKSWSEFKTAFASHREEWKKTGGKGIYVLSENTHSPTLYAEMLELKKNLPLLRWVQYDPLATPDFSLEGLHPVYDFTQAAMVVSFDADLFHDPIFPVSYAADLMKNEKRELWAIESSPTLYGARADHRLVLSPHDLQNLIFDLAENGGSRLGAAIRNASSCVFVAASTLPKEIQEQVYFLNLKYGKSAVKYIAPESQAERASAEYGLSALEELSKNLESNQVEALLIVGGNPVVQSPRSFVLSTAIPKAKFSCRLGLYEDETASACQWFIPLAHELESWGDARTFNGEVSLQQPLITPLFEGKSFLELLSLCSGAEKSSSEIVQAYWQKKWAVGFAENWRESLRTGLISPSAFASEKIKLHPQNLPKKKEVATRSFPVSSAPTELQAHFRYDAHTYDGRFANNPWLQELPDPLTRLTWENVAYFHAEDAKALHLQSGDLVKISTEIESITAPVWIQPGQAKGTVTLTFGYGRTRAGRVGNDRGYSAFTLWRGKSSEKIKIEKLNQKTELACTQEHHSMEGRDLVKLVQKNGTIPAKKELASLYAAEPLPPDEHAWGMVIDLDQCTGCNACVIACQSENNIPVVGKAGVLMGREMHWIRVDRYFASAGENPVIHFQPVPCMHCEKAPCETVCPTEATTHGNGGLNQMTYNRCVGTRYCANNCPYKVRRFNFLDYTKTTELGKMQKNPNVSIRSRGVMEKCTYCVQRINRVRIDAENEGRKIRDQEMKTACQSTCPTQAIHFGDLNDAQSKVRKFRDDSRNYSLLEELGTKPRTTYLAKIVREGGTS